MPQNTFAKKLREKGTWDLAIIYCKGMKPMPVEAGSTFTVEDEHIVMPSEGATMQGPDGTVLEIRYFVIAMNEIARIDFCNIKPADTLLKVPPIVSPTTGMPVDAKDLSK